MPPNRRTPILLSALALSFSAFLAHASPVETIQGSSGKYFKERTSACTAAQQDAQRTAEGDCAELSGPVLFGACECSQGGFQEQEWLCSTTATVSCATTQDASAAATPPPAATATGDIQLDLPRDLTNLQLLDRTFRRRGFTLPDDLLAARLDRACSAGWDLVCAAPAWKVGQLHTLERAAKSLENACLTGDDDACVAYGWSLEDEAIRLKDASRFRAAARRYKALCDDEKSPTACYDYGTILFNELGVKADPRLGLRRWDSACELGSAAACSALAKVYRTGLKTAASPAKAAEYANKACAAGDPAGCVEQALLMDDRVREQDQLARACSLGSVDTCWELASSYLANERPEPFAGRTRTLLELGCDLGDGRACTGAGDLAKSATDHVEAGKRYDRACERGDVDGCEGLVDLILTDRLDRDVSEAVYAFEVACSRGEMATACSELGLAMLDADLGVADNPRARALLRQSCVNETSPAKSCFVLGNLYESGKGGDRDRTLAAQYYKWACGQGWGEACHRRGHLLAKGVGVRRDQADAVVMYDAGCDSGLPESCHAAGVLLDEGTYIPRDAKRAFAFYETGCERGVAESCLRLGNLSLDPEIGRDEARAREAYELAVSLDNVEAHRRLAYMLWNGVGGKKDKGRARELTGIGCRHDDPIACRGPAFQTER
jgi:hypothetical protein